MLLLALAACAYQAPPDTGAEPFGNALTGSLVFFGDQAPGDAIVFVTPAAAPMPPQGTGRPITFAAVPAEAFTVGEGLPSAPWGVSELPDGAYTVTALVDMDRDFHPLALPSPFAGGSGALAGATCGDWVGAYPAAEGGLAEVEVTGGAWVDELPVLLTTALSTERPAFTLAAAPLSRSAAAAGELQGMRVESTPIYTSVPTSEGTTFAYTLQGEESPSARCRVSFLVHAVDADGDGAVDARADLPTLPDLWPRVGLSYLGTPEDDDGDGVAERYTAGLSEGESWSGLATVSPALLAELPVGSPTLRTSLDLLWVPVGLHTADGATTVVQDPHQLPPGAWAITLIEETGQVWTLPNALAGLPSNHPDYDPILQGATLVLE
ncbi:MAG: hypothetical protein JXX28_16915 [Deltaproteobacteria bacterium]|nr:hypothetical protein [Deltaproteobacteria bacterium]